MRGLASPVRLRILAALRAEARTVTELGEQLALGQTTVSNHLRLLRRVGLVVGRRDGRHVHYSLFDAHLSDLLDEAMRRIGAATGPDGALRADIAATAQNIPASEETGMGVPPTGVEPATFGTGNRRSIH